MARSGGLGSLAKDEHRDGFYLAQDTLGFEYN